MPVPVPARFWQYPKTTVAIPLHTSARLSWMARSSYHDAAVRNGSIVKSFGRHCARVHLKPVKLTKAATAAAIAQRSTDSSSHSQADRSGTHSEATILQVVT